MSIFIWDLFNCMFVLISKKIYTILSGLWFHIDFLLSMDSFWND